MTELRYRADIDGLRAISILCVVLFHANIGLTGGYIGVDVFFVISGFLITRIILKDLHSKTFSLRSFWVRRLRRITPAAFAMTSSVIACGLWILDPNQLVTLCRTGISHSLMFANIFLSGNVGYFQNNAISNLFLHTWSLAVEEQFYLFLPPIMAMLYKFGRHTLQLSLALLFLISFATGVIAVNRYPVAAFYLLPPRAWELLAGSLLAAFEPKIKQRFLSEILSLGGFLCITYSAVALRSSDPFPGILAALPVLGACCVILGNQSHFTLVRRLLSFNAIVFIGIVSYSWYLWHWPIMAWIEQNISTPSIAFKLSSIAITFIIAVGSWYFVELPTRNRRVFTTNASIVYFFTISIAFTLSVCFITIRNSGFPSRFDETTASLIEDSTWLGNEYCDLPKGYPIRRPSNLVQASQPPDFILWGDSHAIAFIHALENFDESERFQALAYAEGGKPPITGLHSISSTAEQANASLRRSEKILNDILMSGTKNVVLISRWSLWIEGYNTIELASNPRLARNEICLVNDSSHTAEHCADDVQIELSKMLSRFHDAHIRVWIVRQIPEADAASPAYTFLAHHRFPMLNSGPLSSSTLQDHVERQKRANSVLNSVAGPNVRVIDPSAEFFDARQSLRLYEDRSNYRDDDHLTREGSCKLLARTVSELLQEIKRTSDTAFESN